MNPYKVEDGRETRLDSSNVLGTDLNQNQNESTSFSVVVDKNDVEKRSKSISLCEAS